MKSIPEKVLEALHTMDPFHKVAKNDNKPRWESKAESISTALLIAAGILYGVVASLVIWHIWISPLPELLQSAALLVAALVMFLPFITLTLQTVLSVTTVIRLHKNAYANLLNEINHDHRYIVGLQNFSLDELEAAQTWLKLKCSRIRNRLGIFIGNSEKVALFSMVGMGWLLWKELSDGPNNRVIQALFSNASFSFYNLFILGAAFLTGLAIGALFLNRQLAYYGYKLELLELAIAMKKVHPGTPDKQKAEDLSKSLSFLAL